MEWIVDAAVRGSSSAALLAVGLSQSFVSRDISILMVGAVLDTQPTRHNYIVIVIVIVLFSNCGIGFRGAAAAAG